MHGTNHEGQDARIEGGDSVRETLDRDEILALVEAGICAPSADNRHIVRFTSNAVSLRLRVAPDALQGAPLHRIRFHELAFGAVIENIVLRAAALGRSATVRTNSEWRRDSVVADIELPVLGRALTDPLALAIPARTTNRRLYRRRAAPPDVLEALARAATSVGDVRVHWLDGSPPRRRALALIRLAESERFRHERLHAELFEAIRFDAGWLDGADEGLPPGSLEVEPPFRPAFKAMRNWPLQRHLNRLGAATMLGVRAGWIPAMTAPHLALLSIARAPELPLIDAGRALQRFWLAATQHSMALQPMAASIALANQDPRDCWASPRACARVAHELEQLSDGRRAVMLCRLGYAPEPSLRAGRREARSYLVDASI